MMSHLIEKDYQIFDFIESFIIKYGYSPTVREIADETSLNFASIMSGLRKLRRAGFINYQDGKPRTIVIPRCFLTEKGKAEAFRIKSKVVR